MRTKHLDIDLRPKVVSDLQRCVMGVHSINMSPATPVPAIDFKH